MTLGGDGRACLAAQEGALEAQATAEAGSSRSRGKLPSPGQRRGREKADGGSTGSRALRPGHPIPHRIGGPIVPQSGERKGPANTQVNVEGLLAPVRPLPLGEAVGEDQAAALPEGVAEGELGR